MKAAQKRAQERKEARVLIVDDHPIVRLGLTKLVSQEADLTVCGEAADAKEALFAIETAEPDIAIVDLSLRGGNGLQLTRDIRKRHPELPILVLSEQDESLYAEPAIRAGAKGFIMKAETTDRMITAIRNVLSGGIYLSDKIVSKILLRVAGARSERDRSPLESLTDRQMEVFELLGTGAPVRRIAERLHLSAKTVATHCQNIRRKLGLASAEELLQTAVRWLHSERIS